MSRGLDNDGINLVPDNGTKDRSQPHQPVPALRDADETINLDADDRPAAGDNSILQVDKTVLGLVLRVCRPDVNNGVSEHGLYYHVS